MPDYPLLQLPMDDGGATFIEFVVAHRKALPTLSSMEGHRRMLYAKSQGYEIITLEGHTNQAGIDLFSNSEPLGQAFASNVAVLPSLESEAMILRELIRGYDEPIYYLTTGKQCPAIQPPLYPKNYAATQGQYESAVRDLMHWLNGKATPELATFEGGDKGYYKIPESLKGTGSEMYVLCSAIDIANIFKMISPADRSARKILRKSR